MEFGSYCSCQKEILILAFEICIIILSGGQWQQKNVLSVGVRHGRPTTLLDAANYAKEEWDKVADETIKNVFIKADLRISLGSCVTEIFDNKEFLKLFKNFNITATKQDINECVAIDDKSSHLFQEEILEEANFVEQQAVNKDENITSDEYELMDVDTASQITTS